MKKKKENNKTDKFIITSMEGITIIKKKNENIVTAKEKEEIKAKDIDLDNLPIEGSNWYGGIPDYSDCISDDEMLTLQKNATMDNKHEEIETHPFDPFVPSNASILILGSFPGRDQTRYPNTKDEWFYSAKRNKFWTIIETVYSIKLQTVADKKGLFERHGIAITDVILKAKRKKDSNLDQHLQVVDYNQSAIKDIIESEKIKKIFFTSKFVEKEFKKLFPGYLNIECLPSPSPRYAKISLEKKIEKYKQVLPML